MKGQVTGWGKYFHIKYQVNNLFPEYRFVLSTQKLNNRKTMPWKEMNEIFEWTLHHRRYKKRFSTLLIIKEMKIEARQFHGPLPECLKWKDRPCPVLVKR